jgi:hypothetical protein
MGLQEDPDPDANIGRDGPPVIPSGQHLRGLPSLLAHIPRVDLPLGECVEGILQLCVLLFSGTKPPAFVAHAAVNSSEGMMAPLVGRLSNDLRRPATHGPGAFRTLQEI